MDNQGEEVERNNGQQEEREDDAQQEEREDGAQLQPAPTAGSPASSPNDPSRMRISDAEKQQALRIKAAIEENMPDVDNLNDFWYTQLALIFGDDVTRATETAVTMQEIREAYEIKDTFEGSLKAITRFVQLHPGCLMACSFKDGDFILVVDASKKPTAKQLRHLQGGVEGFLQSAYSLLTLLNADFHAIRHGILNLVECENEKMDTGLGDWDLMKQLWSLVGTYPLTVGTVKHFNTTMFTNLVVAALKRVLPVSFRVRERFQVGLTCEAGNLANIFLQPNPEAANERLLARLEDRVRARYTNEATFRLQS